MPAQPTSTPLRTRTKHRVQEGSAMVVTADGLMETFVVHPQAVQSAPIVLMYMDMWGMRECLRGIARRIATAGYFCAMPDLYYRLGRVRYAEREMTGRPLSFTMLEAERQRALRSAMDGLGDEMVMNDTRGLLQHIDSQRGQETASDAIGVIGFCMGGRHAFCAAGRFAGRVKAVACLHGTDLIKPDERSPHLLARSSNAEIYCGHAQLDQYAPPDVVERLARSFAGSSARYRYTVHEGAKHAYAIPDRDAYDERAAHHDWKEMFSMFERCLGH